MKEKHQKSSELKFLRIDPFYEMNIKAIEISHLELGKEIEHDLSNKFYEIEDYLMTYSFVTKMKDEIVGYCFLTILPNQYGFSRCVVVDQLKVLKKLENQGIAHAMFSQLKKIQRNSEADGIIFHCNLKDEKTKHIVQKWNLEPYNSLLYKTK